MSEYFDDETPRPATTKRQADKPNIRAALVALSLIFGGATAAVLIGNANDPREKDCSYLGPDESGAEGFEGTCMRTPAYAEDKSFELQENEGGFGKIVGNPRKKGTVYILGGDIIVTNLKDTDATYDTRMTLPGLNDAYVTTNGKALLRVLAVSGNDGNGEADSIIHNVSSVKVVGVEGTTTVFQAGYEPQPLTNGAWTDVETEAVNINRGCGR